MAQKILLVLILAAPLGFFPLLRHTHTTRPCGDDPPPKQYTLPAHEQLALHCFAALPGQPFPANLPWETLRKIGEDEANSSRNTAARLFVSLPHQPFPANVPWEPLVKVSSDPGYVMYDLAKNEPVKFLEKCLREYEKGVQGYRCMFLKEERVNNKMGPKEKIRVHFREKPFSVHMDWIDGKGLAARSLYVEGENKGMLLVRPFLEFLPVMRKPVDGPEARATSRFPITQFGLYIGAKRTLNSIHDSDKRGALHIRFAGIEKVEKLGKRPCYKFERWRYDPPEEDDLASMIIYIDQETLFQTGSILYDSKKLPIAEYFFGDIELNPTFNVNQFTEKMM